ncbi:outer membrane protein assembly factor BamB [soil metagenome]
MSFSLTRGLPRFVLLLATAAVLAACSSSSPKPKPAELAPNAALIGVRQAWTARVGEVGFPLSVGVNGDTVVVAGGGGAVAALDGRTGRDLWRANVGAPIVAGVGTDGKISAVVTDANEVVAIDNGRELWRHKLVSQAYTAPFVAGGRVFVLVADRSVVALDGQTGRRLWIQQRPGEPLVLRQSGVMLSVGDTLVVGLSGRLVGINPTSGAIRWEVPIASPRGTNDVERLVDLVGRVSRNGDVVCARAFQANVGCVNAARGSLIWTKPANGSEGVHGDDRYVFGTESDGKVVAWRRSDGERAWVSDRLQYRGLSAPLSVGRSVVIGDNTGLVHLLSREDGSPLSRVTTDGTAIVGAPVLVGDTLVVVTRGGGVFGFQPE